MLITIFEKCLKIIDSVVPTVVKNTHNIKLKINFLTSDPAVEEDPLFSPVFSMSCSKDN